MSQLRQQDGDATLAVLLRLILVVVGMWLIVTAVDLWRDTGEGPETTVTETTVPAEPAVTTDSVVNTITTDPQGNETRVVATTTTPVTEKTTTTVGPSTTARSEAVVLALAGIGALVLLLGLLGDRIKSIGAAGFSVEFAEKTEAVAKVLEARLKSIEGRLNKRATKDALAKTNEALVQVTARVTALEQTKPPRDVIRESRTFIQDQGVEIQVDEMAEPDDAAESQALQAELDGALAELHQTVEALRRR